MGWQRKVTYTLVEEKRKLSTKVKILTSRVSFSKHEKEQAIVEMEKIKKKNHFNAIPFKNVILGGYEKL